MDIHTYDVNVHLHRYAMWTAHRAAIRRQKGAVSQNVEGWFESIGFDRDLELPKLIGDRFRDQAKFDRSHRRWRELMIAESKRQNGVDELSHGRAAKVINVYLKTRYVLTAPCSHAAYVIHPPIDRILLSNLKRCTKGNEKYDGLRDLIKDTKGRVIPWTKMDCAAYEKIISELRKFCDNQSAEKDMPFWKLECYWSLGGLKR